MYEETNSSIDWKGLFLKVIIAFLVILIGFKTYSTLKGNNNKNITNTTETVVNSKTSSTFTSNIEKLKKSGESYFANNKDKLPTEDGNTSMVTLNELINKGKIEKLSDENGKNCDGESSYVTAIKEGEKVKIKANLVCGSASSYSLVYMGENDNNVEETKTVSKSNGSSYSKTTTNTKTSSSNTTCGTSCSTPSVTVSTNTKVNSTVNVNGGKTSSTPKTSTNNKTYSSKDYNYTTDTVTVSFDSNDGDKIYASQRVKIGNTAYNPGSTSKYGYTFKGWYLNNKKYDFSTPVDRNITLVAKFTKNSYSDYDYDYDYNYNYPQTATTTVYTMGWDAYDKYQVSISHKLALPDLDESYRQIRIKKISYVKAINTTSLANTYASRHASTFLYSPNGWESNVSSNSMATVSNAVFSYDSNYKDIYTASVQGFNVTWTSTNISKRCTPFTVYGPTGTAENVCNYGIVYKVTWEYIR